VRPRQSRFVKNPMPEVGKVVEALARTRGETIQVHGAEAAHRFGLTTQVPTLPVYLTNGTSRVLNVGSMPVNLQHTSSQRRLQFAGTRAGLALSALWYLGAEALTTKAIDKVASQLSAEEFDILCRAKVPAWLGEGFDRYNEERALA